MLTGFGIFLIVIANILLIFTDILYIWGLAFLLELISIFCIAAVEEYFEKEKRLLNDRVSKLEKQLEWLDEEEED